MFKYYRKDVTGFWKLPAGVKSIRFVYIFQDNEVVHCAELTPSYWCELAGFEFDMCDDCEFSQEQYEQADEYIRLGMNSEDGEYVHCRDLVDARVVPGDHETMDEACEYFNANPGAFQ